MCGRPREGSRCARERGHATLPQEPLRVGPLDGLRRSHAGSGRRRSTRAAVGSAAARRGGGGVRSLAGSLPPRLLALWPQCLRPPALWPRCMVWRGGRSCWPVVWAQRPPPTHNAASFSAPAARPVDLGFEGPILVVALALPSAQGAGAVGSGHPRGANGRIPIFFLLHKLAA
ncbi:hypothetical protein BS78_K081200 [Paspalum vaginatum]|uniref:Uncharacterized protein n=1 Tax=Paspalum vaginatum TaxID=158149 RepID=A0A9W7XCJ0_9POAL|nr:hypothetical protein BS78_K081200 [Paspalum vaginatum]